MASYLFLDSLAGVNFKYQFFLIFVLSSFIPDIDHPNSKIGQKMRLFSKVLNKLFSHRGFLHSMILPLLIYFIFVYIIEVNEIGLAVSLGISSHLFLDLMTKNGLALFAPFSNRKINGFIATGSFLEKIFCGILLLIIIYLIFYRLF
ncbi:metal-dependent hydrolase [Candidatus Woesearchaeota archaeon]|nr:metal-dependent hydrolase [Candidatus Woesearchaeota archaeon]